MPRRLLSSRRTVQLQAEILEDRTLPALVIDGARRFQTMDGFGVNANVNSWDGGVLRPAVDLLVNDLGSALWRVYIDNTDWETTNDNSNPFVFNWDYYNAIYTTPRFEEAWGLLSELNAHGVTDGIILNFMGPGPAWIGGSTLNAAQEDEWVEMVLSYVYYARFNRGIEFHKIAPFNESDWDGKEGILANPATLTRVLEKIARRLDQLGMEDVRFVQPDTASIFVAAQDYLPAMLANPIVMAKVEDFGVHNYDGFNGLVGGLIAESPYPDRGYWVDEQSFGNDTSFAPVDQLMNHLEGGATATLVFKAYDGQDTHHAPGADLSLGLLQYNSSTQTYTPRKGYHVIKQVHKFIRPGATRIAADDTYAALRMFAFHDAGSGRLTVLGRNTSGSPVSVSGMLANLFAGQSFELYHTDGSVNFFRGADVPIASNAFSFVAPANSVFTLTTLGPRDTRAPVVGLTAPAAGATVSGAVTVSASAADDLRIAGVQFRLDGVNLGTLDTTAPYTLVWNSNTVANGEHQLTAIARDIAGNVTVSSTVTVVVNNVPDTIPPEVAMTSPAAGSTVSGVVTVSADASDNVGVVGVQFLVNGSPLGQEDLTAPYTVAWNTASVPNGAYTLTARARDAAGNATTSAAVSVTVGNAGPTGLVAAWGFEEGTGTTAGDVSGNGHAGAINGAAWTTVGRYGKALSFDGVNDWVTVADSALLDLTTGMTLEAWVRPVALTDYTTVVLKERGATGLAYALYGSDGAARPPAGYVNLGGTDQAAVGPAVIPLASWTHLAATYNGSALLLYVNGVQVASRSVSGSISTSSDPLRIGGNAVWGEFFNGLIDEVRVYNRALTPAEIQADMNTPVGGGGGGLAADEATTEPDPPTEAPEPDSTEYTPVDPSSAGWSTPGVLVPLVEEAVARWASLGASPDQLAALRGLTVVVADLAGTQLGFASGNTVWIDRDAAGAGWFIDPTPWDDTEFHLSGDQGEEGRMDLLTLLVHEMGHVLGLGHSHGDEDVMSETLPPGVRRITHDDHESDEELPTITTPPAPKLDPNQMPSTTLGDEQLLIVEPAPYQQPATPGYPVGIPATPEDQVDSELLATSHDPSHSSVEPANVRLETAGSRTEHIGPRIPLSTPSTVQAAVPDPQVTIIRSSSAGSASDGLSIRPSLALEEDTFPYLPFSSTTVHPRRPIGSLTAGTISGGDFADQPRNPPGDAGRVQAARPPARPTRVEPVSHSDLLTTPATTASRGATRLIWDDAPPDTDSAYWACMLDEDQLLLKTKS